MPDDADEQDHARGERRGTDHLPHGRLRAPLAVGGSDKLTHVKGG